MHSFKLLAIALSFCTATSPVLASTNIIRTGAPIESRGSQEEKWDAIDPLYTMAEMSQPYDCAAWLPDPASILSDQAFAQTAEGCKVDQVRHRQDRAISKTTGEIRNIGAPVAETVVLDNQPGQREYEVSHSEWGVVGEPEGCSNWLPETAKYSLGEVFTQTADDCSVEQAQTRHERYHFAGESWVEVSSKTLSRTLDNQSDSRSALGSAEMSSIVLSAPEQVFALTPFSLTWDANNAETIAISSNHPDSGVSTANQAVEGASLGVTPSAPGSYEYTITATNSAGQKQSSTRTVTVAADPVINTFSISASHATLQMPITLNWDAAGANVLSIDQAVGVVEGRTTTVSVGTEPGEKTYTLTASNTLNGVTRTATKSTSVIAEPYPDLTTTYGPSSEVFANEPFNISWAASNVSNFKIRSNSDGSGVPRTDIDLGQAESYTVTPAAKGTHTYVVTGSNRAGSTSVKYRTVTVGSDPLIESFTTSTPNVTEKGNATFAWASFEPNLSIDQGVGSVSGGRKTVAVGAGVGIKRYTLTATKTLNGITHTDSKTVDINIVQTPTVLITTAPSTSVFQNEPITLSWQATGATSYKIRGNAAASGVTTLDVDLGTNTSHTFTPTAVGSYTYTITAINAAGTAATTSKIISVAATPTIASFSSSPQSAFAGQNVTLSWSSTGSDLSIDQDVGSVTGTSKVVNVGSTVGAKVYTLTAKRTLNGVEKTVSRSVTVTVR